MKKNKRHQRIAIETVCIKDAEETEKLRLKFKAEWEKMDMDRHFYGNSSHEDFLKDAVAIFDKIR